MSEIFLWCGGKNGGQGRDGKYDRIANKDKYTSLVIWGMIKEVNLEKQS